MSPYGRIARTVNAIGDAMGGTNTTLIYATVPIAGCRWAGKVMVITGGLGGIVDGS